MADKRVIRSDPERVRRAEQEIEEECEWREWHRDYYGSGTLGARRYHNSGGATNADHPYQGGLPGLGKGQ